MLNSLNVFAFVACSGSIRSSNVLRPLSVLLLAFAVSVFSSYIVCCSTFFGEITIAWSRRPSELYHVQFVPVCPTAW